jgi:hypothetical protein
MKRTTAHARHEGSDDGAKSLLVKTSIASTIGRPLPSAIADARYHARGCFTGIGLLLILLITASFQPPVNAATLEPATSKAWEEYVEFAHARMDQRLIPGKPFLWVDEVPDRLAKVRAGEVVVSPVDPKNPKRVPGGLIHDWVGAVFIPHTTLEAVLQVVRDYARYAEWYQPVVIGSKVIATEEAKDRFSMLLINKTFFLKTALDTDYESNYFYVRDRRAYSVARTTRIQEIDGYGAPAQRILNEGEGIGLLWRLFSIARYVERDSGV